MYRRLDPDRVIATAERLRARVSERFPDSSLAAVTAELVSVARQTRERAAEISRPHWPLRLGTALFILLMAAALGIIVAGLDVEWKLRDIGSIVQLVEAGTNEVVLIGAAVFFLVSVERRLKRGRALEAIHELRSLAHIVDMHQLTKDPERLAVKGPDTPSSPKRTMSRFELSRYLDYCSETLAVIGKVAALYAQTIDDPDALEAVDAVEGLTTGLSRKIWQKLVAFDP